MKKLLLAVLLLGVSAAHAAYDVKDVALGAKEADVKREFPSAHCKALEWKSKAADRRCDDSRVNLGGVEVQVTFYLRQDALEAYDVRFNTRELKKLVGFLKQRYGEPQSETRDVYRREGKEKREVYKVAWDNGKERAVLTAQLDKRRGSMLVSRGDFEEEIYRVQ
jgi:hypothetical protein